jgi:large subunit ribosomal protein L25
MSTTIELTADARVNTGKAHTRRMRRLEGMVPAVVYGAGKGPESIMLSHKDFMVAAQNEAIYAQILSLNISGKKEKVVLKALQRHPYKPVIMHIDFLRINAKEKITMNVPLHYINEDSAPGVKASGVISHLMTELEIRCLPSDLPEFVEVDMATLEMDASLHISDIPLPKGVELTFELGDDNNQPIASIHKPRAAAESTTESGDDATAQDGDSSKEEDKKES